MRDHGTQREPAGERQGDGSCSEDRTHVEGATLGPAGLSQGKKKSKAALGV